MKIEEIAKSWIEMWSIDVNDPRRDKYSWVDDIEYEYVYENPEKAIDLILTVLKLDQGNEVMEILAAGPLEQVLAQHGETIIERVENIAKSNEMFSSLLGGVWQNSIPNEIWDRVQNVWNRSGWDGNA